MTRAGDEVERAGATAGEAPSGRGAARDEGRVAGGLNPEGVPASNAPHAPPAVPSDAPSGPVSTRPDRDADRALVHRAQSGDAGAFRELFVRHHERAYAVALGVVRNSEDAHDVVQDAFVKVHRHLANFQGDSSFYTWLYRIVMNLGIDHLRRRKSARGVEYVEASVAQDDAADGAVVSGLGISNPAKTAYRRQLMVRVEDALATLPDHHQRVIVLREIEGMSYEEIAEVLEVPKGTVMSRLFHARRKMQVALQDVASSGDLEVEE
jgi:RNA polymerase sigma-70 factor (ECF subfamily)